MRRAATWIVAVLGAQLFGAGAWAAEPALRSCADHTFLLDANGAYYGIGNYSSTLSSEVRGHSSPVPFSALENGLRAQAIACGIARTLILADDGSVWQFSETSGGRVEGLPPLVKIAASSSGLNQFYLGIDRSGAVWGWGENFAGQIVPAPSERVPNLAPRRLSIPTSSPIVEVSAGRSHSMALDQSGTVWIWGVEAAFLTVGRDHTAYEVMEGLPRIASISAGGIFSLARSTDGTVWSWGDNEYGALGVGLLPRNPNALNFFYPTPRRVPTLTNVRAISAGATHAFALGDGGSVWAWGTNANGEIGDGSNADPIGGGAHYIPSRLATLGPVTSIVAGPLSSGAITPGGAVLMWGWNYYGRLGNGTFADQTRPQPVILPDGGGFLDLTPSDPLDLPGERLPPFGLLLNAPGSSNVTISGTLSPRPEDVGKATNLYVFALAPASMVKGTAAGAKDAPVACVLAQLSASGELRAVSASNLQAAVTNTLLQANQAINVATNATSSQLNLATLFAGYGTSPGAMLAGGTNRSVATFAAPNSVPCVPQAPTTGWWWSSAEGGRGYSIEVRGNHIFFAAFHYDTSGRATWNFATGNVSMDGAYFTGELYGARSGQTLTGAYPGLPQISSAGNLILAFNDATHGTMIWPGGAVALERLPFTTDGLTAPAQANLPETGWWWNPQENGRGFFVEWQNGGAQIAGYMYDTSGNPIWYLSGALTPDPNVFSAPLRLYGNGQSMSGPYRAPTLVNDNAGTLGIRFLTRDTATMTLPGGRQVPLERMRF